MVGRWPLDAAVAAAALTAIVAAMFPTFVARAGWLWALVALLGFSVAAAGPVVLVQTGVQLLHYFLGTYFVVVNRLGSPICQ